MFDGMHEGCGCIKSLSLELHAYCHLWYLRADTVVVRGLFVCSIRYQAHGDSLKLESRMFKETERRIRDGLLASLDGGSLKWLQGYQAPNPLLDSLNEVPTAPTTQDSVRSGEKSGAIDLYAGEKGASSVPRSGEKADSRASDQLSAPPRLDATQYDFKGAMGFLKEGFEELVKCRCVSIVSSGSGTQRICWCH